MPASPQPRLFRRPVALRTPGFALPLLVAVLFPVSGIVTPSLAQPESFYTWGLDALASLTDEERLPLADPDRDRLPNIIEWYCGQDPLLAGPLPMGVTAQADQLTVWFQRSLAADPDAGTLERSTDLLEWRATQPPGSVSVEGNLERMELTVPASGAKQFFQLVVAVDDEYLARWSFDEDGGGSIADESGGGSDGVAKNGTVLSAGVASLDGTDDFLEVPLTENLKFDGAGGEGRPFTMCAWIKLDAAASLDSEDDVYALVQKGSWTKPPFVEFGLRGGAYRGLFARMYNSSGTGHAVDLLIPREDIASVLQPGGAAPGWHHVAFSRDANGVGRLFLDGHLIGEKPGMLSGIDPPPAAAQRVIEGADSPLNRLWIGRRYSRDGGHFQGELDDVRLFRRSLGESEFTALTTSTRPSSSWLPWPGLPITLPIATIFVAPPPLGSDSHDGSEATPVASIGKALDLAHDLAADGRRHIYVKHGEYHEGMDRVYNADAPLTDRRPGELYIARPGITLEAEPWDGGSGRVTVLGSIRKDMDPDHPLASKYPQWEEIGDGLFKADRVGKDLNPQAVFLDGKVYQYGNANMGSLTIYWVGKNPFLNNDPANLPENSFYAAEKLKLKIPANGGLGISDGMWFLVERGSESLEFEFCDERDDFLKRPNSIAIPYSDGRDRFRALDGSQDSQAEMVAKVLAALTSPAAAALDLNSAEDAGGGVIELGSREGASGQYLALASASARSVSPNEYDLYVKLPDGVDPNDPQTKLDIPYRPLLLAVRAPGAKVKGFRFMYNNLLSHSSGGAIHVNTDDVLLEENEILWCDFQGLAYRARATGGFRPLINRMTLINNRFSFCGNNGLGGSASRSCRFIGNDTSGNNWRNFRRGWHHGGFKIISLHEDLVIQGHTARYNLGNGLWFDNIDPRKLALGNEPIAMDAIGVRVSESVAEFNKLSGFQYEISRNGEFYDNVSRYNRERGFYISNCINTRYERNLSLGNGMESFGFDTTIRLQSRNFFSYPRAHPLHNNWANTNVYGAFGAAGVTLENNILRNNALNVGANHDGEDQPLSAHAGWGANNLPAHPGTGFPLFTKPGDTLADSPTDQTPLVGGAVQENTSGNNILWRNIEPVIYGYSPSQYLNLAEFSPASQLDGLHLDRKDIDAATDTRADRVQSFGFVLYPGGLKFNYVTFPNDLEFGQSSVLADRFEFLDPGAAAGSAPRGLQVIDPDFDEDGMVDWWEELQGLDPRDATGVHGADGDPDEDGRSNLQEFQTWKLGENYPDLETYLQQTDPTYYGNGRNGTARDLDGDKIPDIWEAYYGIGGITASEDVYLKQFLLGQAPGPLAQDVDLDGLPDSWEQIAFKSLDESAEGDPDGDGFNNAIEFRHWTLPFDSSDPPDADADGLSDLWEASFGLNPASAVGIDGGDGDADADGSTNRAEFEAWSNPRDPASTPPPP